MKYAITHLNTVQYAAPVRLARFALRLRPVEWPGQKVSDFALSIDPQPVTLSEGEGGYYVNEARFALREAVSQIQIESRFEVEVAPPDAALREGDGPALADLRERAMAKPELTALSPASYIFASPIARPERDIALWSSGFLDETMPALEAGRALMKAVNKRFQFDAGATKPDTPPIEAFNQRRGVCQDYTHVMIIAARAHGIPAAYVSGYLRTFPPPGQERLVGADAMHAWVSLWCGDKLGWIGFDPTNDKLADEDHILIGMGRDYSDVAPIDGTFRGGGGQTMTYSVDVAPLE